MRGHAAASVLLAAGLAACGVARYRAAVVTARFEIREVVAEGGTERPHAFRDERLRVGDRLIAASAQVREVRLEDYGDRQILLVSLDAAGTQALALATDGAEGRRLAFLVDDRVVAAPVIRGTIPDGEAQIAVPEDRIDSVYEALTRPSP